MSGGITKNNETFVSTNDHNCVVVVDKKVSYGTRTSCSRIPVKSKPQIKPINAHMNLNNTIDEGAFYANADTEFSLKTYATAENELIACNDDNGNISVIDVFDAADTDDVCIF